MATSQALAFFHVRGFEGSEQDGYDAALSELKAAYGDFKLDFETHPGALIIRYIAPM